jgi:AraC-like DNA-binding protein
MFQFFYTNSYAVNEIKQSNEKLLNNIQHNIDGILDTLDSSSTSIIFNDHFEKLMNLKSNTTDFNYELSFIVDRLYVHSQSNPTVDILIYLPQSQYLISSLTANHISYISGSLKLKDNTITEEDWINKLNQLNRDSYFISRHMSYKNFGKDSIVFGRSIPLSANTKLLANIFVSVPYRYIQNISDVSSGSFMIIDEEGTVLEPNHISFSEDVHFSSKSGAKTIHIDDKPYILSYVKSNSTHWYYAVLVAKQDYWEKANYIRIIAVACTLIALVLGCISIYWLLKRNYRPVHNVVSLISNNEVDKSKNEFILIREAYTRLYKENKTMGNNLSKQLERSREIYLLSKLKDVGGYLADEDSMEYFQLNFDNKKFALVSFYRSYTEQDIPYFDNDSIAYINFLSFVINNVLTELLDNKFQYYHLNDGELILCFFVLRENETSVWEQECLEKLGQLYEFLKQKLDLSLSITMGEVGDNFKTIHNLYDDILEAHEYNCMIHEDGIVLVKDIIEPNHHKDKRKSIYEKMLNEALMLSNYRKAASITETIFDEFMAEESSTFPMQKFYIYHLIDTILNSSQNDAATKISSKSFHLLLENIPLCSNTQTLKKAFLNVLKAICGLSQEKYEEKMQSFTNNIKNYVNENYMDCNLNIGSIADSMKLNPKYMSRLFKEENEEGLLDYINTVRIQKARLILAARDITLEDLALMVGYTNVRTFRRAFYKIEGTTPSQYKKMDK